MKIPMKRRKVLSDNFKELYDENTAFIEDGFEEKSYTYEEAIAAVKQKCDEDIKKLQELQKRLPDARVSYMIDDPYCASGWKISNWHNVEHLRVVVFESDAQLPEQ